MGISGIYQIQSKIKPIRIYVGSAINVSKRRQQHTSLLRRCSHPNKKLQRHYNKYGEEDLVFSVLLGCEKRELTEKEQFFIDSLKPWFNLRPHANSNLGIKFSMGARQNMSKAHIGNKWTESQRVKMIKILTGRPMSEKSRKALDERNKVMRNSPETRDKISKAQIGKKLSAEHKEKLRQVGYKRKQTDEAKLKVSIFQKGRQKSEEEKRKISDGLKKYYKQKKIAS